MRKDMRDIPKVSCLMLTRNRFSAFKKAVQDFTKQDYANTELIIVNNGNFLYKRLVQGYLKGINSNITYVESEKLSIGELRNLGMSRCNGEFIAIFDDDDRHRYDRISKQIEICLRSNVSGTVLRNFVAVEKNRRNFCHINHGLDGSMIFQNPYGYIKYTDINQGEDTAFIKKLKEKGYVIIVLELEHELYEYHYHGRNTVSRKHFRRIAKNQKTQIKKEADD
jgi:glycosyltransferase involved in cell wall biosynthesis